MKKEVFVPHRQGSLQDQFYQAEDYFFRSISQQCLDFGKSASAYLTGVQQAHLNPVTLRKIDVPLEEILRDCNIFYGPLAWIMSLSSILITEEVKHTLLKDGFDSIEITNAMYAPLDQEDRIGHFDFSGIQSMDQNLSNWMIPLDKAFGSTQEISQQYVAAHKKALYQGANLSHFSLYEDNKPISSITLSIVQTIARIDDVGTLPSHQNKGHASKLIYHALKEARYRGATTCYLEASATGLLLYQRLGFNPLFDNCLFERELDKRT